MGGVKAKRHLFPSCREPEDSTWIITQRDGVRQIMFFQPISLQKNISIPDENSFRRTTNALGGQQADNKFSRKIVVRQMGCCPPNPFSGGQRADKNTNLTTLLSALSALSAKPENPWYVGLFRADNKFAKPPVCCPPVVRHTIYDTRRTTRTTRTRRTRRTRRTTNNTKTHTPGGQHP